MSPGGLKRKLGHPRPYFNWGLQTVLYALAWPNGYKSFFRISNWSCYSLFLAFFNKNIFENQEITIRMN